MDRIGALFDLDKTLLDTSSGQLYARYMFRTGQMSRGDLMQVAWWTALNRLGVLDMQALIPRLLAAAAGSQENEMLLVSRRWFAEEVVPHIAERGLERVAEHQAQGHVVAIVSASTQYVVAPMAEYLGIPGQYVCTHVQSTDGVLTGEAIEPACYGQGKIVWAERFAEEQ
ncbi:MAG TPA: HAD-IB family phosphatase, partial [Anaerolineae bacterium]|nr:HAD-IB family phosphatase [Anaerolineae bacterium]